MSFANFSIGLFSFLFQGSLLIRKISPVSFEMCGILYLYIYMCVCVHTHTELIF